MADEKPKKRRQWGRYGTPDTYKPDLFILCGECRHFRDGDHKGYCKKYDADITYVMNKGRITYNRCSECIFENGGERDLTKGGREGHLIRPWRKTRETIFDRKKKQKEAERLAKEQPGEVTQEIIGGWEQSEWGGVPRDKKKAGNDNE